jgi:WD40 repeat protein
MIEVKNNPILTKVNSVNANSPINSVSFYPSGIFISILQNRSIIIYDINFQILQEIKNAHEKYIIHLDIKDELNFATCSLDLSIKTWYKKEKEYKLNKIIKNAHSLQINQIIYNSKNIITCSQDNTIKIWEFQNENYQNITTLAHSNFVNSILLLEDKKILISSGWDGSKFWNITNYELLFFLEDCFCIYWNSLKRMNDDNIIIGGSQMSNMKIISIKEKKVIKEIKSPFLSWGICIIKNMNLILVGGNSKNINIYSAENLECIQIIENAHNNDILGFIQSKNNLIISYSKDSTINIWSL